MAGMPMASSLLFGGVQSEAEVCCCLKDSNSHEPAVSSAFFDATADMQNLKEVNSQEQASTYVANCVPSGIA
eukprot:7907065-Karenia_brevis.AAC.1